MPRSCEAEHVGRLFVERAPEQGADASEQLLQRERLGQVVVGAGVQPLDAVADGVAGGEQEDRHAVALAPQAASDVQPVEARHHDVEHDRIGCATLDRRQRTVAVGGEGHLVAGQLEGALERLAHGAIVVCHEDEHGQGQCARAGETGLRDDDRVYEIAGDVTPADFPPI